MSRPRQLSTKAATIVAAFDKTAQQVGRFRNTQHEDAARVEHQKSFDKLRRYITRLERFRETTLRKGIGK